MVLFQSTIVLWKSTTTFAGCIVTSAQLKALVVSIVQLSTLMMSVFSYKVPYRKGNGGIQPQDCDWMETPKPSPSTVEGKKGGTSQVDMM